MMAALVVGLMAPAGWAAEPADDPVVARVNGEPIRRGDLERALQRLPAQYQQVPLDSIFEPLLERIIDSKLIVAEARARDLEKDPGVQTDIQRAREEVLRESLLEREVEAAATPAQLRQRFEALKQQPGFTKEEVSARHILVATEAEAREVLAELQAGKSFDELAKARSTDPSAATNGGDLGWFSREMMVPEFSEAAFTIAPGTVGAEPVKSQFGWHVIKVEERRQAVPSFEEKEAELREQLARDTVEKLVAEVRNGASIERFGLDGSPRAP